MSEHAANGCGTYCGQCGAPHGVACTDTGRYPLDWTAAKDITRTLAGEAYTRSADQRAAIEREAHEDDALLVLWCCPDCGCTDVESQMWVNSNTDAIVDDTGSYNWCPQCETDGGSGEQKCLSIRRGEKPYETAPEDRSGATNAGGPDV